jgi:type IV pilus assembly protein PilX
MTMKTISRANAHRRQRGAALVVALIMLLVMTVLGITAMQVTRMEERMAGNSRDVNLAFQAAEAGLRDAEARILAGPQPMATCAAVPCALWDIDHPLPADVRNRDLTWWNDHGAEYGVAGTHEIVDVTRDPVVATEHMHFEPDSLAKDPSGRKIGRDYYKITANATGASDTANVVLESTYTKRRD